MSMKSCEICGLEIPDIAKKCTHCGSFQNRWQRFSSGVNLGALTALVPVLTLAATFIYTQMSPVGSNVRIFPPDCTKDTIIFTASNDGNRDAVVVPRGLYVDQKKKNYDHEFRVTDHETEHILVPAGEITTFRVASKHGTESAPRDFKTLQPGQSAEFLSDVLIYEFDADAVTRPFTCTVSK